MRSLLLIVTGLGAALALTGCGGQPDSLARDFYQRMAALDVAGMEQLVCEEERPAFRDSIGFLDGFAPDRSLDVQDFQARTERSDGTSATMSIDGRFVHADGEDTRLSGRVHIVREGGEWCLSGERDGFRAIREDAAEAYFLLYRGVASFEGESEGYRIGHIAVDAGVNTPPPGGPPPALGPTTTTLSGLTYQEVAPGSGPEPQPGQTVRVHYTLWLQASGTMIDSSHGGEPFEFVLGGGLVVDGFDEGVATMREGGRRRLIVPPRLGYGDDDDYEDIPPNSTLIFDVELVDVR